MPTRPTTFYVFNIHYYKIQYYNDDIYVYLSIHIIFFFFIVNFTVFTVFFKKMFTYPLTTTIIRGVCQNLFIIGRNPPLPHRTVHIAPFLNYNNSYYAAKPKEPRCPPIGSLHRTLYAKITFTPITMITFIIH